eukprot:CAMPEP_0184323638 /NCGR_PEP_ID=MMETSP1049-20130417/131327_1 /TAXON_ID=77928 /ORGANISM="Proteomonas sulcata, Strain CCMP704" /LENGTH=60 /DNA_ID=CAMNT_0026645191 /DNA_START=851 /DNA_END=1030 /DNA_ORIENTATION=-
MLALEAENPEQEAHVGGVVAEFDPPAALCLDAFENATLWLSGSSLQDGLLSRATPSLQRG